ncbi:MAG: cytochrome B5 [Deltaproteobacteria bacterium]|nr:cytochrome B5 [Deltaproteobacteria bacterium]
MKKFTEDDLKRYDGSQPGDPVYFAYKGKVYDVTKHPLFIDGIHFEHYAGTDLSDFMDEAPHGDEALHECEVVGEYEGGS